METKDARYEVLAARAAELALPRCFETDLTMHDRACLASNPVGRRFLWAIGESGTTLVWLDPARLVTERLDIAVGNPVKARSLVRTLAEFRPELHYWDGEKLEPITAERAVALLAA